MRLPAVSAAAKMHSPRPHTNTSAVTLLAEPLSAVKSIHEIKSIVVNSSSADIIATALVGAVCLERGRAKMTWRTKRIVVVDRAIDPGPTGDMLRDVIMLEILFELRAALASSGMMDHVRRSETDRSARHATGRMRRKRKKTNGDPLIRQSTPIWKWNCDKTSG